MGLENTFVEAVVAAVLVALLIGVFGWLIRRWVKEEWTGRFTEDGHDYSEELTIYRIGTRIRGKSRLIFDEEGKRLTATYRIRGVLKHAIITAYFEGIDNAERGAFLIKYSFSKSGYSGKYLLIDHEDGISSVDYSWMPAR